jgi:hypothetical protein
MTKRTLTDRIAVFFRRGGLSARLARRYAKHGPDFWRPATKKELAAAGLSPTSERFVPAALRGFQKKRRFSHALSMLSCARASAPNNWQRNINLALANMQIRRAAKLLRKCVRWPLTEQGSAWLMTMPRPKTFAGLRICRNVSAWEKC